MSPIVIGIHPPSRPAPLYVGQGIQAFWVETTRNSPRVDQQPLVSNLCLRGANLEQASGRSAAAAAAFVAHPQTLDRQHSHGGGVRNELIDSTLRRLMTGDDRMAYIDAMARFSYETTRAEPLPNP